MQGRIAVVARAMVEPVRPLRAQIFVDLQDLALAGAGFEPATFGL